MASGDVTSELDLHDYAQILGRRKGVVLLTVLLVVVGAMTATFLQRPVYEAGTKLLLQPRGGGSVFGPETAAGVDPARVAKTEIEVIESRLVRLAVQRALGGSVRLDVSVRPVEGSDVLEVRARSGEAAQAAAVANAYARAYLDLRRQQSADELVAGAAAIQAKVAELQRQIDAVRAAPRPADASAAATSADPLLENLLNQQSLLNQRLDEAQVDAALRTVGAQLLAPAVPPVSPVEPRPVRNGALALGAGLLLGVGLAILADHLDDTVRTRADLARAASGVPLVGFVPVLARARGRRAGVPLADLNSPAGEAYRSTRTSLQLLSVDRPLRRILVTSALGGEGKTTTVANLAAALGRAGERVVVVDGDLRRPSLHRMFGLDNRVGLTSVLVGDVPLVAALQPVPDEANVRLLASGPKPPTPPEMLSSKRAARALDDLTADGWVVLIDSPPLFLVTDALVLAGTVDATILVVNAGTTTRRQVNRALELLGQVPHPRVATILNRAEPEPGDGYGFDYHHEPDPRPSGRRPEHTSGGRWFQRRSRTTSPQPAWPTSIDDPSVLLGGRDPTPSPTASDS